MTDCGFPVIRYRAQQLPHQRGQMHGEMFRDAIQELYRIRLSLMREKNPSLDESAITELAAQQWEANRVYDQDLTAELEGIAAGSGLSLEALVVLNNYTDFRDIQLVDQGCSVVYVNYNQSPVAGQTWDMHGTAKNYVCCIVIENKDEQPQTVLFSLVGCVGMMGYTDRGTVVGINNINTDGAVPGALWPVVVRKTLSFPTHEQMAAHLTVANVTGGHNYLIGSRTHGEMWEVMPGLAEKVDCTASNQDGFVFHTNHCLGQSSVHREVQLSQNSTTHIRYELLAKKSPAVRDFDDVFELLNDHENYPKSICSNWQSNTQDPSITCGGAVGELNTGRVRMWRGDRLYDDNYVVHDFQLAVI